MALFDIGAVIFFAGFILVIRFLIKRNTGAMSMAIVMSLAGALIMLVAYYLVMGNQSVFDKMIP